MSQALGRSLAGLAKRLVNKAVPNLFLCLMCVVATACGGGLPSVRQAQQALVAQIDKGSDTRLQLLSIQKTDGRTMESMGLKIYELLFVADIELRTNALVSIGSPFTSEGHEVLVNDYQEPSPEFSWGAFGQASQGFRPALKGDRLHLTGSVSFEQRESGWVPTTVRFTLKHDESTRDMEAVKAAEAKKREDAEASRKREVEREAELAREKAARDARAERSVVLVDGPGKGMRAGYVYGYYYIGRLTSNDVLLVEPLKGQYSEVQVLIGLSPWTPGKQPPSPYRPGEAVPDGALGGRGLILRTSGQLRIELPDASPQASDIALSFVSSENMSLRVTILCTQGPENPPCQDR